MRCREARSSCLHTFLLIFPLFFLLCENQVSVAVATAAEATAATAATAVQLAQLEITFFISQTAAVVNC